MSIVPATFDQRLLAQSIDITFLLPFLFILDGLWETDSNWFWAVCILLYHGYAVGMEASALKATVGKKMAGLSVRMDDERPVGLKNAVVRNLCKWISLLPISAGFFMIYLRRDARSFHDIVSKSKVVSSSE